MSKDQSSTDWKEIRRLQALELKRLGWKQKDIAGALGVTKGAVSQWIAASFVKGKAALFARPHTGRPPELTPEEKWLIPELLSQGAEAYGFRGDIWTCPRVRKVLEWEFGVSSHKSHVARLLKEVNWTPQLPIERATERDEGAIAHWRTAVWKEMKKKRGWSAEPSSLWTNRAATCCRLRSGRMRLVVTPRSSVSFKPAIICRCCAGL